MRSMRGLAVLAAAVATTALAPAGPAAASAGTAVVQWQAHYGARNHSIEASATAVSPDGSTVFTVGGAVVGTGFAKVVADNAATGAVRWQASYSGGKGFHAVTVSPDGSTVYVTGVTSVSGSTGFRPLIIAYNAVTGAKLWQVVIQVPADGLTSPSAVVSADSSTLFVTVTGQTAAYNAATGAVLWSEPEGGNVLVASAGDTTLYVAGEPTGGTAAGTIQAFSASTGATIWQDPGGRKTYLTNAALSPDGTTLYVSGVRYTKELLTTAYSTTSGTQLWSVLSYSYFGYVTGLAVTPDGSAVITGDAVETDHSGHLAYHWLIRALSPQTGAAVWSQARWGTQGNNVIASALALSPDGSTAYVTGLTSGSSAERSLTVGYRTATGTPVWSARYDGRFSNLSNAVAVSPDGSQVFIAGSSAWQYPNDRAVMTTVAYSAA